MSEDKGRQESLDLTALELDVILQLFIGILSEKAWQYMGLRLKPGKQETSKNMILAKSSIDSLIFLSDQVGPRLPPEDANRLRSMISDLQLNYVKQI
jgi:hypothetical protein